MPFEIPFVQIVWWVMTACALVGAIGVVSSNNLFHSALFLVLSLFGVAGYYVLLSAGFLAVVQLMVYIGAIVILVLFAIMFSRRMMKSTEDEMNRQWLVSVIVAAALFSWLIVVVNSVNWPVSSAAPPPIQYCNWGWPFLAVIWSRFWWWACYFLWP